ncbi:lytic transglycosylase domain-containing protein [Paraclostridium bifermentans]|uniref:lytic transglycosylase domain-containing protein n=1 Tax=Paraclostridium bifermentans TaxID=1490 RepID=UPI00359CADBF
MIDNIELLAMTALMSNNSYNSCKCNSKNKGFDMVMISLLEAISNKNKIYNSNNIVNQSNYNDNFYDINTVNSSHNSNKIEVEAKSEDVSARIENAVKISSQKYGVDENLIKSIIKVESNFNPNCESSAGAKGLMQLMPENCRDLGITDPFNIEQNIDGGTRHIKEYLDRYDGNVEMALMAYNGGPTRMMRRGVKSLEDIYLMPKETQNYVPKVMKYYKGEA